MVLMCVGKWWEVNQVQGYDIDGKVIGIIGYGWIGYEVEKWVVVFGMWVLINNGNWLKVFEIGVLVVFDELLEKFDYIILFIWVMVKIIYLINVIILVKMKGIVFIINFGCGVLVDIDVLIEVLKIGVIYLVVFDVFEEELLFISFEFYKFDNVLFSFYIGGGIIEVMDWGSWGVVIEVVCVLVG